MRRLSSQQSEMEQPQLSLTEYAVLGLLAEAPSHGFAISKELEAGAVVGRILTVRRPLVYRALDRLVPAGMAELAHTEPGDAGPQRTIHRITPSGKRHVNRWIDRPVEHIRDMRIEFQLKLSLLQRSGRSPVDLVEAQYLVLLPTLAALETANDDDIDHLELWRQHNASAALSYLRHLADLYTNGRSV